MNEKQTDSVTVLLLDCLKWLHVSAIFYDTFWIVIRKGIFIIFFFSFVLKLFSLSMFAVQYKTKLNFKYILSINVKGP